MDVVGLKQLFGLRAAMVEIFTSSKLSARSFLAFRSISAAVLVAHQVAHALKGEGWHYFVDLSHWNMMLACVSECMLLALAICPHTIPTAARVELALWHPVQPLSMIQTIVYWVSWSFRHPLLDLSLLHYLDFYSHGLYCLQLLVSLFLSRLPFAMCKGIGWTVAYSLLFSIGMQFQAKLQPCAGDEPHGCQLYEFSWQRPQLAILMLLLQCAVACPVVCAVYAGLVRCRDVDIDKEVYGSEVWSVDGSLLCQSSSGCRRS